MTEIERRRQFINRINQEAAESIKKDPEKFRMSIPDLDENKMNKRIEKNITRNEERIAEGRNRIKEIGPIK